MGIIRLEGTIAAAGTSTLYTVPALTSANTAGIRFNNTLANDITLSIYNSVSLGTTNIYTVSLSAGDTLTDNFVYVLTAGDQLKVTTTAVNTTYILTIQEY
jgi:hypothetical protein